MRVGIEIGGTFTDLVATDGDRILVVKVPSTPASPDLGALDALKAAKIEPATVQDLVHGSTVATNAVLERKGGNTAFVTTRGFRDVLLLQRHSRNRVYDLTYQKPEPIVPRGNCFEVDERIGAEGLVIAPLDEAAVERDLVPALKAGNYSAVAICLIGSYFNDKHEQALERILVRAIPDLKVTRSSIVSREFREYERASTTTLAAYVQPIISTYLDRFVQALERAGFAGHLSLMQSNGGRIPAEGMRKNAVTALLSGPAAGVIGAIGQAAKSGVVNLLAFDMGGTSTDVSLVENGKPTLASEAEIDGLPIRTPFLDIVTVGAGGGSLIWVDDGGMLRVGPRSAGARPGPACYGLGGLQPTMSDAMVVAGLIAPKSVLGGTIVIDEAAALASFEQLSKDLNTSPRQLASAAIRLAATNIVRAIQIVSTERGHDPRDFSLVPFGGMGPMFAAMVATELGMVRVLVPANAGVLSAYGLLVANHLRAASFTQRIRIDEGAPNLIKAIYKRMLAELVSDLQSLGVNGPYNMEFSADMRYVGQAFEVAVDIQAGTIEDLSADSLQASFDRAHRRVFLHGSDVSRPTEAVSFRLSVSQPESYPQMMREPPTASSGEEISNIFFAGEEMPSTILSPEDLARRGLSKGPMLVRAYSSTTFVPPGWTAAMDESGNIMLTQEV